MLYMLDSGHFMQYFTLYLVKAIFSETHFSEKGTWTFLPTSLLCFKDIFVEAEALLAKKLVGKKVNVDIQNLCFSR